MKGLPISKNVLFFLIIALVFLSSMISIFLLISPKKGDVEITPVPKNIETPVPKNQAVPQEKPLYAYDEPRMDDLPTPLGALVRLTLSVGIICVMIVGTIYGLKVTLVKKAGLTVSGASFRVLDSLYLSPQKSLHLVEVAGEVLVVGVSDNGMNLLKEITDPEKLARIKTKSTGSVSVSKPFKEMIADWLDRFKKPVEPEVPFERSFEEGKHFLKDKISELHQKRSLLNR